MQEEKSYKLTSYPVGSIREIWTIAWPLMIGLLSSSLMIFMDRILLARFSIDSMNASATAGTCAYAFLILPLIISSISEVFVGQAHGKDDESDMGVAAWQMIWFSFLIAPIFIIIAFFGPKILFYKLPHADLAEIYFFIQIAFGSLPCFAAALMGFFAGQGKVKLIAVATLTGNFFNIILDIALIFGIKNVIPPLGIKGAAIATVIAQGTIAIFLFTFFLSKKAKSTQGTKKWKLNFNVFISSLKVGFPASIAHTSEFFSHFVFFRIMALTGTEYITLVVLVQSIYILIFFVIEGLSKAVTAVCSNLIGGEQYGSISKNLKSSFKLNSIFFAIAFTVILFFSPGIFKGFFTHENISLLYNPNFIIKLNKASLLLCVFLLFDGWCWSLIGMLTAAKDTKFIMKIGLISPWILYLLPIWIGINYFNFTVDDVWMWIAIYGLLLFLIYLWRYKSKKWKKITNVI